MQEKIFRAGPEESESHSKELTSQIFTRATSAAGQKQQKHANQAAQSFVVGGMVPCRTVYPEACSKNKSTF